MNQDFARFTPKQILAHCQNNARSMALNPVLQQTYQRDASARAQRKNQEADDEVRAFRIWRTTFLMPRRDAWGHFDEASRQAQERARRALMHLHFAWAALTPLLTDEERAAWLERGFGGT
ncbi:hypothetical protein [Luteibacter sp. 3190]|uniref:hypothetical protein n=1 Tax=Luteibacter sp. 3190 TaxID=2817736 RepID=UPI0028587C75|nr:hypothetical protein [Luteibacter sp. 3190]MDR6935348.1 hypothetical protein [Luteibacter sp. 3190]